jgi:hypothetical protein
LASGLKKQGRLAAKERTWRYGCIQ